MTAIDDLLTDWAAAECHGDVSTLDRLLTDDFAGIGPVGFVLPKPAWLARFQSGLSYDRFELEEIQRRDYDAEQIEAMREQIESELGPADVVVANAGGNPVRPGPIEHLTEAEWRSDHSSWVSGVTLDVAGGSVLA